MRWRLLTLAAGVSLRKSTDVGMLVVLLVVCLSAISGVKCQSSGAGFGNDNGVYYRSPCPHGDGKCTTTNTVLLGGLFPVRTQYDSVQESCSGNVEEKGFQRMMAMVYAIDQINRNETFLPGIKFAFEIRNTCGNRRYTSEQVVQFLHRGSQECQSRSNTEGNSEWDKFPVSGIVGASSSSQSVAAADLAELFRIPMISYASTSARLSASRYTFFFRVLPSDEFQARVMADIISSMGSTFINILHSEGEYGEVGATSVKNLVQQPGRCIARTFELPATQLSFQPAVQEMAKALNDSTFGNAKTTVAFAGEEDMEKFFTGMADFNLRLPDNFTWIASDSWATGSQFANSTNRVRSRGMLGVVPTALDTPGFLGFYNATNPVANPENPWLPQLWEETFKCNMSAAGCVEQNTLTAPPGKKKFEVNSKVSFAVDATLAFWYAVKDLKDVKCRTALGICEEMRLDEKNVRARALIGKDLRKSLLSVEFKGNSLPVISFNENGDLKLASYQIYNLDGRYLEVGTWTATQKSSNQTGFLNLSYSNVTWHSGASGRASIPVSRCSADCPAGSGQAQSQGDLFSGCCWTCVQCEDRTGYSSLANASVRGQVCATCPIGQVANSTKNGCDQVTSRHASITAPFQLVNTILAIIGIVIVFIVALYLYLTPGDMIEQQSTLRVHFLCAVLLGMLVVCVNVFLKLVEPSNGMCLFTEFWIGSGLVLVIVPIAVRSLRGSVHHIRIHWFEHRSSNSGSFEAGNDDDSCFQDSGYAEHKSSIHSSPGFTNSVGESRFSGFTQMSEERHDSVFVSDSGRPGGVSGRRRGTDRRRTVSSFVSSTSDKTIDNLLTFVLYFIALTVLSISTAVGENRPVRKPYINDDLNYVYYYCTNGVVMYAGLAYSLLLCVSIMVVTVASLCLSISPPTVLKYAAMSGVGVIVLFCSASAIVFTTTVPTVKVGVLDLFFLFYAFTYLVSVVIIDIRFARKQPITAEQSEDSQYARGAFKRRRTGSEFVDMSLRESNQGTRGSIVERSPKKPIDQFRIAKSLSLDSPDLKARSLASQHTIDSDAFEFSNSIGSPSPLAPGSAAHHDAATARARFKISTQPRLERVVSAQSESSVDGSIAKDNPRQRPADELLSPIAQTPSPDMPVLDYKNSPYPPSKSAMSDRRKQGLMSVNSLDGEIVPPQSNSSQPSSPQSTSTEGSRKKVHVETSI